MSTKNTFFFSFIFVSVALSPLSVFAKAPISENMHTLEMSHTLYDETPVLSEPARPARYHAVLAEKSIDSGYFDTVVTTSPTITTQTLSGTPFSATGNGSPRIAYQSNGYDANMNYGYTTVQEYGAYTGAGVTVNSAFGDEPVRSQKSTQSRRSTNTSTSAYTTINGDTYSDFAEVTNAPRAALTKSTNTYGASVLGANFSFLPQTAVGWIGLMILSLFFVFFLRYVVQAFKA